MDTTIHEPYQQGERVYFHNPSILDKKFYGTVKEIETDRSGNWAYWIKFDEHGVHRYINYADNPTIYPVDMVRNPSWEV